MGNSKISPILFFVFFKNRLFMEKKNFRKKGPKFFSSKTSNFSAFLIGYRVDFLTSETMNFRRWIWLFIRPSSLSKKLRKSTIGLKMWFLVDFAIFSPKIDFLAQKSTKNVIFEAKNTIFGQKIPFLVDFRSKTSFFLKFDILG